MPQYALHVGSWSGVTNMAREKVLETLERHFLFDEMQINVIVDNDSFLEWGEPRKRGHYSHVVIEFYDWCDREAWNRAVALFAYLIQHAHSTISPGASCHADFTVPFALTDVDLYSANVGRDGKRSGDRS